MGVLWEISLRDGRPLSATQRNAAGRVLRRIEKVWTLSEFCRRAGKSRRQLYRDLKSRKIRPLGKFLGEWLLEPSELARLRPVPKALAPLFPEYDLGSLDAQEDRDLILSRLLGFGGGGLRWAFSYYGPRNIREFVRGRGSRVLDARSLRFWCVYFGLRVAPDPARLKGRRWGGAP